MTLLVDSALLLAADGLDESAEPNRYLNDPVGWASDKLGAHLWSKQREIAEEIGVSQMQVSRLLTRALAQLRASLTETP